MNERKLKILFVSEYYPPIIKGGGEINLSVIAKGLAKKGMDIYVLTSKFPNISTNENKDNVKIFRLLKTGINPESIFSNIKRSIFLSSSVKKEILKLDNQFNFDIIHLFGACISAANSLKKVNNKLYATIESYPSLCPKGDRFYKGRRECTFICSFSKFLNCQYSCSEIGKMKNLWYIKYNLPLLIYIYFYYRKLNSSLKILKLVAISKYVQNLLYIQGYKSQIIPNAIDIDSFSRKFKDVKKDKNNYNKFKIAYFGSLTRFKGPHIILEAIKGLDLRCDFYGDGSLKSDLLKIIKDNALNVEIHPPIPYDAVPKAYAKADIIVFPSIWPEPFGRISIEAMASGKPFIASKIGGIIETAEKSGILVRPGNPIMLRKAINKLMEDKLYYKKLSTVRNNNLNKYLIEKVINDLIFVYLHSNKR